MVISTESLLRKTLGLEEFCTLYLISRGAKIDYRSVWKLRNLEMIDELDDGKLTDHGKKSLEDVLNSAKKELAEEDIGKLAESMRLIFPAGKKEGTSKYWRDNKANVEKKLRQFLLANSNYTPEDIIDATKKYVDSFGSSRQLMRVLPYFISKDGESDLLTTLENKDDIVSNSNDQLWTQTLL